MTGGLDSMRPNDGQFDVIADSPLHAHQFARKVGRFDLRKEYGVEDRRIESTLG
jgi:hypothetical protein